MTKYVEYIMTLELLDLIYFGNFFLKKLYLKPFFFFLQTMVSRFFRVSLTIFSNVCGLNFTHTKLFVGSSFL